MIIKKGQGGVLYKTSGAKNSPGVVASNGKKKIGQEAYYKVLKITILPWLRATYPGDNYIWTQGGVSSHTSAKCQKYCVDNMADF
uniref:Uncharacterized protein n=1 Tax=Lepeophtheirus salmonis TaxID=72036 RepID=A0A0K2U3T3_LEPSM